MFEPRAELNPPSYYCLSKKSTVGALSYTISQDCTDGQHVRRKRLCAFDRPTLSKRHHGKDSELRGSAPPLTPRTTTEDNTSLDQRPAEKDPEVEAMKRQLQEFKMQQQKRLEEDIQRHQEQALRSMESLEAKGKQKRLRVRKEFEREHERIMNNWEGEKVQGENVHGYRENDTIGTGLPLDWLDNPAITWDNRAGGPYPYGNHGDFTLFPSDARVPRETWRAEYMKDTASKEPRRHRCHEVGCNKYFDSSIKLRKHEKVHTHPWKCPVAACKYNDYGWPTAKELERHQKDKHPDKPVMYRCLFRPCAYMSKRESNCKQHMEKAHGWTHVRSKKPVEQRKAIWSEDLPTWDPRVNDFFKRISELSSKEVPGSGVAARAFAANQQVAQSQALEQLTGRPKPGKPTLGVLNLDSQRTLHQTRLHALPKDDALPPKGASAEYDVWDPTNWMLDGLLEINKATDPSWLGKEEKEPSGLNRLEKNVETRDYQYYPTDPGLWT